MSTWQYLSLASSIIWYQRSEVHKVVLWTFSAATRTGSDVVLRHAEFSFLSSLSVAPGKQLPHVMILLSTKRNYPSTIQRKVLPIWQHLSSLPGSLENQSAAVPAFSDSAGILQILSVLPSFTCRVALATSVGLAIAGSIVVSGVDRGRSRLDQLCRQWRQESNCS